ncbi:MAG: NAD(P)H-binding protein [Hyphomicrobiales bacterium]|nr:NAD(P)H-binding protein [Hyphomicrobiales bacterium]
MRLFVFGLGYSAQFFLRANADRFTAVSGTVRSADKVSALGRSLSGVDVLRFDDLAAVQHCLEATDAILVSVAPAPAVGDPVLKQFGAAIEASPAERIVYLSTIGVYAGQNGLWVDEDTPPARGGRSEARIAAESEWLTLGARSGKLVFVLRLAGIYGPGSSAIDNVRAGSARRIVKPGQVFNRIHVADIAGAIAACLSKNVRGGIFNVCDDEPAPPQDVVVHAAMLIGVEPPPEVAFEAASLSPMAQQFWANNQRVSNRRLRQELGVRLLYPTYREGLAAIAGGS